MSNEEEVLALLRSPDLCRQIIEDMTVLTYEGNDTHKLLLYLTGSSRLMDKPMITVLQADPSSGQMPTVGALRKLFPSEALLGTMHFSDQAFHYMHDDALTDVLCVLEDVPDIVLEEHWIGVFERGERFRIVPDKIKGIVTVSKKVKGSLLVCTRSRFDTKLSSRCFILDEDASDDISRALMDMHCRKYSIEGYRMREEVVPRIINRHHILQGLLKKRDIKNPFAAGIDREGGKDASRFLDLVEAVCFLRQYQKEIGMADGNKYIECDDEDYRIAYWIMSDVHLYSYDLSGIPVPKPLSTLVKSLKSQ